LRLLQFEAALVISTQAGLAAGDFGSAVVTQLRTAASDLLRAAGFDPASANQTVRKAIQHGGKAVRAGRAP
jgi:hypothetical protein